MSETFAENFKVAIWTLNVINGVKFSEQFITGNVERTRQRDRKKNKKRKHSSSAKILRKSSSFFSFPPLSPYPRVRPEERKSGRYDRKKRANFENDRRWCAQVVHSSKFRYRQELKRRKVGFPSSVYILRRLSVTKNYKCLRALTLKQHRPLLYHRGIKRCITYEQNRFICTGPLIPEQRDIPRVIYIALLLGDIATCDIASVWEPAKITKLLKESGSTASDYERGCKFLIRGFANKSSTSNGNFENLSGAYVPESGPETTRAATNRIQFKVSRNDLGAIYECRASSQALNETMITNVEVLAYGEYFKNA